MAKLEKMRTFGLAALGMAVLLPLSATGVAQQRPAASADLRRALTAAVDEEYHSEALYTATIKRFGRITPFSQVMMAERRHQAMLAREFARHGWPMPANRWQGRVPRPANVGEACRQGQQRERDNIALLDRLLAQTRDPEARRVFGYLRNASSTNHLRAFERCIERVR